MTSECHPSSFFSRVRMASEPCKCDASPFPTVSPHERLARVPPPQEIPLVPRHDRLTAVRPEGSHRRRVPGPRDLGRAVGGSRCFVQARGFLGQSCPGTVLVETAGRFPAAAVAGNPVPAWGPYPLGQSGTAAIALALGSCP